MTCSSLCTCSHLCTEAHHAQHWLQHGQVCVSPMLPHGLWPPTLFVVLQCCLHCCCPTLPCCSPATPRTKREAAVLSGPTRISRHPSHCSHNPPAPAPQLPSQTSVTPCTSQHIATSPHTALPGSILARPLQRRGACCWHCEALAHCCCSTQPTARTVRPSPAPHVLRQWLQPHRRPYLADFFTQQYEQHTQQYSLDPWHAWRRCGEL